MCFSSAPKSGPSYGAVTDPATGNQYYVEQGVPADYAARGATTVAQYQTMAAQDLSDKQIAAQKESDDAAAAFNQKQYDQLKAQYDTQQAQTSEQATRQTDYDTGRANLLSTATDDINSAFAKFTPDYYTQYEKDYLAKAQDDIDYQKNIAKKNLVFGLARQGLSSSQAGVNQAGLLEETAGRSTASRTDDALAAEASLKSKVAAAKQDLNTQVGTAESIGSPIAGTTTASVNSALDTTKSAIKGVTSTSGDVASSLSAVPTVSGISNIFSGVLGAGGSYLAGNQAYNIGRNFGAGYGGLGGPVGTSPSGGSTRTT